MTKSETYRPMLYWSLLRLLEAQDVPLTTKGIIELIEQELDTPLIAEEVEGLRKRVQGACHVLSSMGLLRIERATTIRKTNVLVIWMD